MLDGTVPDQLIAEHGGRGQSVPSGGRRNAMGWALVRHERVEDVVDERGNRQRVHGFQRDPQALFGHRFPVSARGDR